MLHVVIPTLNAAETLPRILPRLAGQRIWTVDGGSSDGTADHARQAGCSVLVTSPGRGGQLSAGAKAAMADGATWLLFLHADSQLPDDAFSLIAEHCQRFPASAAAFRLAFDDPHPLAAVLAAAATLRSRWLGLPWGDQGLLCPVPLYEQSGGYAPLPLMEDVDLVRRLGRSRLRQFPAAITTDAKRYRRDGWIRRPLRNVGLLCLYALGVSPHRLARWYR